MSKSFSSTTEAMSLFLVVLLQGLLKMDDFCHHGVKVLSAVAYHPRHHAPNEKKRSRSG